MSTPSLAELQKALSIAERLEKLNAELDSIIGGGSNMGSVARAASTFVANAGKRTISAATVAKMRASQQARWAKKKGAEVRTAVVKTEKKVAKRVKGAMSAAGRASIVAAQKARWAKIKGAVVETAKDVASAVIPKSKKKARRKISPEARARMAEAAKKRWAAKKQSV